MKSLTEISENLCSGIREEENQVSPRGKDIILQSKPISDYLSTKWYQYLLLLLAQATDSRLEICCFFSEHKYTSISDNCAFDVRSTKYV